MKQKYDIDELYVATVAPVAINGKGNNISRVKKEKIYAVVVKDNYKRYFDLISGKTYYHFGNSSFGFVKRNLDDFYVFELVMMRQHLKTNVNELSIDEIISISNELNGIVEVPKLATLENDDDVDTINDYFLKEIIKTSAKIDDSIDSLYKEELINELRKLAEEYVDMVKEGILDPAKVTRSALQNATSVASTLLTTESVVANIKEDIPAMPAGGGMGMM